MACTVYQVYRRTRPYHPSDRHVCRPEAGVFFRLREEGTDLRTIKRRAGLERSFNVFNTVCLANPYIWKPVDTGECKHGFYQPYWFEFLKELGLIECKCEIFKRQEFTDNDPYYAWRAIYPYDLRAANIIRERGYDGAVVDDIVVVY